MTTLRFPDEIPVSGEVLAMITAALGIGGGTLVLTNDSDGGDTATDAFKADGWSYERPEDDAKPGGDRVLLPGVTGWPVGSRWTGGECRTDGAPASPTPEEDT